MEESFLYTKICLEEVSCVASNIEASVAAVHKNIVSQLFL